MKENNLLSISTYPNQTCSEKPIIAAIYARVSSGRQINGYSLEEQIRLGRERCKIMGWNIRYIFCENGKSAQTVDRPKFQMMIEKAKHGAFDVLVFWKLDRFCRSLLDVVNVEKKLRECGVSLHSISESLDTVSSFGKFNFRNLASAAELERDLIRERSRMGMKALALQHKWPNRLPPLGYNKGQDARLKVNPEETELVRKIYRRYITLKSMPQVAYELNKKRIKTKRGMEWSTVAIKNILDNEIYIGNYKVSDVEVFLKDYKIISKKLFNATKEIRGRSRQNIKPMPMTRKEATVERVFNEYLSFLDDEVKEEVTNYAEGR